MQPSSNKILRLIFFVAIQRPGQSNCWLLLVLKVYQVINPNSEFMQFMECGYELCAREYVYSINLKYLDGFSAVSRKIRSWFCSCSLVLLFSLSFLVCLFKSVIYMERTSLKIFFVPCSSCLHFQTKKVISSQLEFWEASFSFPQIKSYGLNINKYPQIHWKELQTHDFFLKVLWWRAKGLCVAMN